jgi:hypothetical protein
MSEWSLAQLLETLHEDIHRRLEASRKSFGHSTTKNLSVNSANLGSRRQTVGIERCKLGEDRFQDASDQVMDRLGYVLGEG